MIYVKLRMRRDEMMKGRLIANKNLNMEKFAPAKRVTSARQPQQKQPNCCEQTNE